MSNKTTDGDGDGELVNQISATRRDFLKATVGVGTAAAFAGPAAAQDTTTTTTTTTSDSGSATESQDIVTRDTNVGTLISNQQRYGASTGLLVTGIDAMVTGAEGSVGAINEMLFGGAAGQNPARNMDAHNAAYANISDAGLAMNDMVAVWQQNGFKELENLSYTLMERSVADSINAGDGRASAKTKAKQRIRENVFVTPERNLMKIAEAVAIRVAGAFWVWNNSLSNGYLADDNDDGTLTPRTSGYWVWDIPNQSPADWSHPFETYVKQFNINAQKTTYELVTGGTMELRMCQVITRDDVTVDGGTMPANFFPVGHEERFSVAPVRGTDSTGTAVSLLNNVKFYHPDEGFVSVSDHITPAAIRSLYDEMESLRATIEDEIDQYVDTMYSEYDPGEVVDPSDLSIPAILQGSGGNWVSSGESGFAEVLAGTTGYTMPEGMDGKATIETLDSNGDVVDTYTGLPLPQTAPKNLPYIQYKASNYSVDPAAGTLTVTRSALAPGEHGYEWTHTDGTTQTVTFHADDATAVRDDNDEITAYEYAFTSDDSAPADSANIASQSLATTSTRGLAVGRQTSSALLYVASQQETADGGSAGAMDIIDPSSSDTVVEWRISSVDSGQWYVAFSRSREPTATIDNSELADLWDKYSELQKKYNNLENSPSGGAGGGGSALPQWALYGGGGALAVILGAIGLGAGDS